MAAVLTAPPVERRRLEWVGKVVIGLCVAVTIYLALVPLGFLFWQSFLTPQTAEKAAQYATSNSELEQRVRVLEQIVTDGGMQTAAQIEALRAPRLTGERK